MSTRIPSFLLGGINLTYNFLGTRTLQSASYGAIEVGLKLTPIVVLFAAAGLASSDDTENAFPQVASGAAVPERRSSLT